MSLEDFDGLPCPFDGVLGHGGDPQRNTEPLSPDQSPIKNILADLGDNMEYQILIGK